MKVIVDNKIPYIKDALESLGIDAVYIPGGAFTNEIISDADALIIRTRTKCNEQLLKGSKVKFIATATIGFDHIDADYCKSAGIEWTNCPGCNSGAVEQYLHSSLLLLAKEKELKLNESTIGIVGVGHVGSRVARVARELGMRVLLCDTPRQDNGEDGFVSLEEIADESDVITFHTPLIRDGKYKTYHLADENFFSSLKKRPYIINTSRGEVVETEAILKALDEAEIKDAIIDVWENEPDINEELLRRAFVSTFHIAGYSADGKINATRYSLQRLTEKFGIEDNVILELPPLDLPHNKEYYSEGYNYLEIYNPKYDTNVLKNDRKDFEKLRGDYHLRREL